MPAQPDQGNLPLTARLALTEDDIERRLRFVGFTHDDVQRVTALTDIVANHVDEFATAFFAFLAALDEAAGLVQNPALMETARRLKIEHLRAMVGGVSGLVVTGLSTAVAQALATLGVELEAEYIVGDLQGGLEEGERVLGELTAG